MKTFIKTAKTTLFSVIAATAIVSVSAQASVGKPVAYANQTSANSVSVQVYQNGHPVEDATVKLFETNGSLSKELMTNRFGRVNISQLSSKGPLTVVAETDLGTSKPRYISLMTQRDRK